MIRCSALSGSARRTARVESRLRRDWLRSLISKARTAGEIIFTSNAGTEIVFQPSAFVDQNGTILQVAVRNPGFGYVAPPTLTLSGPGSGAVLSPVISPHLCTAPGQEIYNFSGFNTVINGVNPGIKSLIAIQSVSISYGIAKPTLDQCSFSEMQAYLRSTGIGQTSFPQVWAQYGQGSTGSLFLWPIPSVYASMDVDAYCLPIDLVDDSTPEAIPYPWTDCVPYYAAFMAFQAKRMRDDASYMFAEAKRTIREGRAYATASMVPSYYNR